MNFFLDFSVDQRVKSLNKILSEVGGTVTHFSNIEAENQLRGKFTSHGVNGRNVEVFLTMTPTSIPKIQEIKDKLLPILK